MRLENSILQVNIVLQDKFRQWFSTAGLENQIKAGTVILGDSDIDYGLAPNISTSRILSSSYGNVGVKHKMIYNGVGKNLSGIIKAFVRRVKTDGTVQSVYQYNLNETWIDGTSVPDLVHGKDWDTITFDDTKMGYIIFFETVLDYYITTDGTKQRLAEVYDYSVLWNGSPTTPANWEYILDVKNGSMFICKEDTTSSPISVSYVGEITVTGQFSKKTKKIKFNI